MIVAELLLFTAIVSTTGYLTTYLSPHDAADASHAHGDGARPSGPIAIVDPWAPATPGNAPTGAGYMKIVNNQPVEDQLVEQAALGPSVSPCTHRAQAMALPGCEISPR